MPDTVRILAKVLSIGIFVSGALGNILLALLLSRRKLRRTPSNNFLRIQAVLDLLSVATILVEDSNTQSTLYCKIAISLIYIVPANSAWALAIVSVERFIFIKYGYSRVFRRAWFQLVLVCGVHAWNVLAYIEIYMYYEASEERRVCIIVDAQLMLIFDVVDVVNAVAVPFLVMFGCSAAIVESVYLARKKILRASSKRDTKRLRKDIQFSVTIILFNVSFLVLSLPLSVVLFFYESDTLAYKAAMIVYYAHFVVNLLILFFCNSLIKKEFLVVVDSCLKSLKSLGPVQASD